MVAMVAIAEPIFQHADDDGEFNIVVTGDTVILACEHGHSWTLESTELTRETAVDAFTKRFSPNVSAARIERLL